MGRSKVRGRWAIVFVWSDNCVVRANVEHVFSCLWRPSVDGKAVVGMVDSAPILKVGLE